MNETEKLKEKIKELEDEVKRLRKIEKEFEEFKAMHMQTVSELRRALNIKPNKKEKLKSVGAPKGHKGYARHTPERFDYIKAVNPTKCPNCGNKLGNTQEVRQLCVIDVRPIQRVKTTRYDIHRKYCTKCKKLVEQDVPNALPYARFGLNLMLLVMYLRLGLRLPGNKVCEYFKTMYNLSISEGEIVQILKQLVRAYGEHYRTLERIVKNARVKHTDSTSWRIDGKNYYAWVFIACGIVLYKIRKRNNHKVAMALFGKKQKGMTLVVDRHSAFRTLAEKTGFLLQLCWAHIIVDSKALAKDFGTEGKRVHKRLKEIFELAKGLDHQGTPEMVDQLKWEICALAEKRNYRHATVRRFVNNLCKRDIDNLFRFVTDPDIDSTNNISERELRHLVIIRKISNGSRSTRGAHATAMLLSVIQTLRMEQKNVLQGLHGVLQGTSTS